MIKQIVRYEPYYGEWITMEDNGDVVSVEFTDDFNKADYPDISFVKLECDVSQACSVPIVLQLLLTRRCNYKCINCHVQSAEFKKELTTNEVKNLILQAANKGVLMVRFSGGESSLRSDIVELIKYTKSLGLKCALLSSCLGFSDELWDILPELCYVQPHLDSAVESTFNKLTGGDHFKRFESTIERLYKQGISINPATTLQKENLNEIKTLIDFSAKFGLRVRINALYKEGDYKEGDWDDYYNNVVLPFQNRQDEYLSYAEEQGVEFIAFTQRQEWGEEIGDTMAVISSWGRSFIVVDSEGLIYPAPFLMHKKELVMGSIRNGDNIYELWKNAPILKKLRNLTKERIGCGNCRMDCAFSNPFFSYSYFGEFGHVLPHIDCINKRFQ